MCRFDEISFRSCRPDAFYKKGVLRNFAIFKGKHMSATLLEKRLWHRCFPVNFANLTEHVFPYEFCEFNRTPPVAASLLS